MPTFQEAATEMTVVLEMADDGFDGRSAAEFAFDRAEDAALLAREKDAAGIGGVVATLSLIDVGAFDGTAGQPLGVVDHPSARVAVIGISR